MKKFRLISKILFVMALTFGFVACAPGPGGESPMGSSSGGGSYGDESGNAILDYAVEELKTQLTNVNPAVLKTFPKTLPASKILKVLENIKPDKNTVRVRDGLELMFDYDEKTQTIYATKLFYSSVAHVNLATGMQSRQVEEGLVSVVESTKLKLLHEIAHLGGYGQSKDTDHEARLVAMRILSALGSNYVLCAIEVDAQKSASQTWPRLFSGVSGISEKVVVPDGYIHGLVIQRSSLKGFYVNSANNYDIISNQNGGSSLTDFILDLKNSEAFADLRGGLWFEKNYINFRNDINDRPDGDWLSVKGDENSTQFRRYAVHRTSVCHTDASGTKCNDFRLMNEEVLAIESTNKFSEELTETSVAKQVVSGTLTYNYYESAAPESEEELENVGDRDIKKALTHGVLGEINIPVEIENRKLIKTEVFPVVCVEKMSKVNLKILMDYMKKQQKQKQKQKK